MHIVLALALSALSEYIPTKRRLFHSPICSLFLPNGLGLAESAYINQSISSKVVC